MKTKLVTPCPQVGYKASFEAYFVDLGCLEKHNFSTALLENSRKHHGIMLFSVNSHIMHYLSEAHSHMYTKKKIKREVGMACKK